MLKKTCKKCSGMCCKYVAVEIDTPEEIEDFEDIKWYVCHKNINVYVDEENIWHIEFLTPCEFLGKNSLCKIYEIRPHICREYNQDECPFHNEYKEKYTFKKLKDVEKYIEEIFDRGLHIIPED
jgi:Fe-S-cluster containining protein